MGVAALQPDKYLNRPVYWRPATVAVIGILVVAVFVSLKICREHGVYSRTKKDQARVAEYLAALEDKPEVVPKYMLEKNAGKGFLWSLFVVVAAALAASGFCLSLVWR